MNQNLRVNKTNFHTKGFALGLALKQRRNATRKSPIAHTSVRVTLASVELVIGVIRRKNPIYPIIQYYQTDISPLESVPCILNEICVQTIHSPFTFRLKNRYTGNIKSK